MLHRGKLVGLEEDQEDRREGEVCITRMGPGLGVLSGERERRRIYDEGEVASHLYMPSC